MIIITSGFSERERVKTIADDRRFTQVVKRWDWSGSSSAHNPAHAHSNLTVASSLILQMKQSVLPISNRMLNKISMNSFCGVTVRFLIGAHISTVGHFFFLYPWWWMTTGLDDPCDLSRGRDSEKISPIFIFTSFLYWGSVNPLRSSPGDNFNLCYHKPNWKKELGATRINCIWGLELSS